MTHERKSFWLFSMTLFLYVHVDELVKETKGSTEKATKKIPVKHQVWNQTIIKFRKLYSVRQVFKETFHKIFKTGFLLGAATRANFKSSILNFWELTFFYFSLYKMGANTEIFPLTIFKIKSKYISCKLLLQRKVKKKENRNQRKEY